LVCARHQSSEMANVNCQTSIRWAPSKFELSTIHSAGDVDGAAEPCRVVAVVAGVVRVADRTGGAAVVTLVRGLSTVVDEGVLRAAEPRGLEGAGAGRWVVGAAVAGSAAPTATRMGTSRTTRRAMAPGHPRWLCRLGTGGFLFFSIRTSARGRSGWAGAFDGRRTVVGAQ
jgi:hypothetical protein